MKNILKALMLFFGLIAYAQDDNAPELVRYTDMLYAGDSLFALHDSGRLVVWDLKTNEKLYTQNDTLPKYTAIAKDRNGIVYLASSGGYVYKLKNNSCYKPKLFFKDEDISRKIYFLFFNSKNKMYFVLNEGLYCAENGKIYDQFENTGFSAVQRVTFDGSEPSNFYFETPKTTFIDSNDRIWMSMTMGEFGGTRYIFDTKDNKILDEITELNHIQSFCEDTAGNIYVTEGLQHMMNFGTIYKVTPDMKAIEVYDSQFTFDYTETDFGDELFIGPGAWNKKESRLYFASSQGVYSTGISGDNKLTDVEKLFEVKDLLYERENLAMGMQMAVKKLDFTPNNHLIFLTAVNGIGIHNGKELIMLK